MKKLTLILVLTFMCITINAQDVIIPSNTTVTWGTGGIPVPSFTGNLILEPGAILLIVDATVWMDNGSCIIILKKNSKLIVDHSKITSIGRWHGISYDNSGINISANDIPGCFISKEKSVISNADIVFSMNNSYFGGGVIASNTEFANNEQIADIETITTFKYGKKPYNLSSG